MNMQVSTFSTTQKVNIGDSLGTITQESAKTTSAVPAEVQKRFDAAQVRLANAYALPERTFGAFSFSTPRQNEVESARKVISDLKQDFPGVTGQSSRNSVPAEARKAYETQQISLADAATMPVVFAIFGGTNEGARNEARQSAKNAMAGLEKDFPGLLTQPKANETAKGISTGTTANVPAGQAAASAAKIASTSTNTAKPGSAVASKPIDEATADQAKSASGALGAYMHSNNIDVVDVNKLYTIANNDSGQVPEDVQKAAEFMVKNPDVYKSIETNDIAGADGISARNNFDKAAQGLVAFNQPVSSTPATTPATTPTAATAATTAATTAAATAATAAVAGPAAPAVAAATSATAAAAAAATTGTPAAKPKLSLAQQAKNASGTLAAYMRTDNLGSVDMNKLYAIANNSDCETSKDVSDAAAFMLKNPDTYRKIETNDISGVDGISGLSNFENMAMGKIKMDEPAGSVKKAEQPAQKQKNSVDIPVPAPKLTLEQQAKTAAGALAAYARTNNVDLVDPNMLYSLTMNADKKASKEVQQAASFMLTHPDTFKRIETSQWSVVDGRASTEDFNRAAQGMTKFV